MWRCASSFSLSRCLSTDFSPSVIMGVGIGGDYPLSAVITSEFAATRIRGRMMTATFWSQGYGMTSTPALALLTVELTLPFLTQVNSRRRLFPSSASRLSRSSSSTTLPATLSPSLSRALVPAPPTTLTTSSFNQPFRPRLAPHHRSRCRPRCLRSLLPSHSSRDSSFHHGR
jgi:MFS family permease